jgi:sulfite reductase (NADPH) hemoprotein beta-component
MAASDDPRTLGRTRLSFADTAEIDDFVKTLSAFERGELTPDQWRVYRLVRGTYGQRQPDDSSMVRVKIPQGVLDARQLDALADVGETWSRGFGHITTRQNLQFHFVRLHDVEKAMRRLAEVGLTTREACGNSVRNITACPWAGVAADEVFDVTPYAEALTRYFLRHRLSSVLPRKFKIGFEGCATDHAYTAINDLGWRARKLDGWRGFRLTVGGGTSILPRSGAVLYDFVPAGEIFDVAEAIVRVFHRLGDFKHKQRNRMKFLIRELGWDVWRAHFHEELAAVRKAGGVPLPFDPEGPPVEEPPVSGPRPLPPSVREAAARASAARVRGPGITPALPQPLPLLGDVEHWRRTNVRAQKQEGYSSVAVTLPLGDITSAQLRLAGDLAQAYGDGTVRVTHEQDLLFRWVRTADVAEVYRRLFAAGLGAPDAGTVADVTSCPGAESCRIAVTQSRGLGRLLTDHLRTRPDLVAEAADLKIKISGCPNGCGQHHIAGLGFQGSVRRLGDRVVPQYFVMVGGDVDETGATFGRIAAKIPARRVVFALERLLELYRAERREDETATAFFRRVSLERVKERLADLETLSEEDAQPADHVDLGDEAEFKVEVLEGECSA